MSRINHALLHSRSIRTIVVLTFAVSMLLGSVSRASTNGQRDVLSAQLRPNGPAKVGHPLEVMLTIDNAFDVRGYEALVTYDSHSVRVSGVEQYNSQLAAAGRDVYVLHPVNVENGTTFGAVTCPASACPAPVKPDHQQGNLSTRVVTLATITVVPAVAGQVTLGLSDLKVIDASGAQLPIALAGASVTLDATGDDRVAELLAGDPHERPAPVRRARLGSIAPAHSVDLTRDGRVDVSDVTDAAIAWTNSRETGRLCGDEWASQVDVVADGCFDVSDIQGIAAHAVTRSVDMALSAPAAVSEWVVNSTADSEDAGLCTSSNECTLPEAIREANKSPDADHITFAIQGTGPHTIQLKGTLPSLTGNDITINGYTQPGAQPNTDPNVSNARIMIQIRGGGGSMFGGLEITGARNTVRGIAFFNLKRSLVVSGPTAQDNVIAGCFFGVDASGKAESPNGDTSPEATGAAGMRIEMGATNTRVGGSDPADRNIISGSVRDGLLVKDLGTNGTQIIKNIVGLSPNGTTRVRNWGDGIDAGEGVQNTRFEGNVISGNNGEGLELSHIALTSNNVFTNNYIGATPTGHGGNPAVTGNQGYGIAIEDQPSQNQIGPGNVIVLNGRGGIYVSGASGYAAGNRIVGNRIGVDVAGAPAGNTGDNGTNTDRGNGILLRFNTRSTMVSENIIAHNARAGVMITGKESDFNTISRNSFSSNGSLAIDIDPVDVPNSLRSCNSTVEQECMRAPVITVTGTILSGTTRAGSTVELYLVDNSGEGKTFVTSITADGNGNFSIPISEYAGQVLTVTATDQQGNTSEFSRNTLYLVYLPLVRR